ncbi:MAG: MBL fold metallo-hydrolase [Ruminococcaceae bacterium]|nr:MBL fold metallo-hydrolase [Oscillospiraceae bacterium]
MKKTISLLLILCLLGASMLMFSSCGKTKVDLEQYSVIYDSDISDTMEASIKSFGRNFGDWLGNSVSAKKDDKKDGVDTADYEILIGNTSRVESAEALSMIEGHGYAIVVSDYKIAIVGTTNLFTKMALDEFAKLCFEGGIENVNEFQMQKETVVSNAEVTKLDADFNMIFSVRMDYDNTDNTRVENESDNPEGYDYPVNAAEQIREYIAANSVLKKNDLRMSADSKSYEKEIIVGVTDRTEGKSFLSTLDSTGYGISVNGNKIVVGALNVTTLKKAVAIFFDAILDSKTASGEEGKYDIVFPAQYSFVEKDTKSSWVADFPRPTGDGLALTGTTDVGEGSYSYSYTGEGATANACLAYFTALENAGYTLYDSNTIGNNLFRTYNHAANGISLYVTYAEYTYDESQKVNMYEPTIRIVAAKKENAHLIPEKLLSASQSYTKVTDTRITAMRLDYNGNATSVYGNCYIVTLEDGSFIVYDGGMTDADDEARLYNVLADLHKTVNGKNSISRQDPIRIAAWYLSHGHGDHYGNFLAFAKTYGQYCSVEYLLGNFTSNDETYNTHNPNNYVRDRLSTIAGYFNKPFTYVRIHSGQQFYLRNVGIEVLYTHEDLGPWPLGVFNNSSTVIRLSLRSTDGQGNLNNTDPTTFTWLGDLQDRGSKTLRAMYGNYMQSDMVQVAHHGWDGCEWALYQLIAPECVWWPTSMANFNSFSYAANSSNAYARVDYKVINELSSVNYHIISDFYNVTMTIKPDGRPDYSIGGTTGLYSAGETVQNTLAAYGTAVRKIIR